MICLAELLFFVAYCIFDIGDYMVLSNCMGQYYFAEIMNSFQNMEILSQLGV